MVARVTSPRSGAAGDVTMRSISRQTLVMLPVGIIVFGLVLFVLHSSGKLSHFNPGPLSQSVSNDSPFSSSFLAARYNVQLNARSLKELWSGVDSDQGPKKPQDQIGLPPVDSLRLPDGTAEHISEIIHKQLSGFLAAKEKESVVQDGSRPFSQELLPELVSKKVTASISSQLNSQFAIWSKQVEELKQAISQAKASAAELKEAHEDKTQLTSVDTVEVEQLVSHWDLQFNLSSHISLPKRSSITEQVLPAPHLQDCEAVTILRKTWDQRSSDGSLPAWYTGGADDAAMTSARPQPPWVVGADLDNLQGTRAAQAAIWAHQHPKDCRDPAHKFLVVNWWVANGHGIGSQLHGWSVFLAVAKTYNRTLIMTDSFTRADHEGCVGLGRKSSLGCYFMAPEDPVCKQVALELLNEQNRAGIGQPIHHNLNSRAEIDAVLRNSTERVLHYGHNLEQATAFWDLVPDGPWGQPWISDPTTTEEVAGKLFDGGESTNRMRWWRAQATSYLLRFPTQYLCSLCNHERNRNYGRKVAREVLEAKQRQLQVSTEDEFNKNLMVGELEHTLWSSGSGLAPYFPRPMLSIHVRQGDKGIEMRLFDFGSYMAQAERIRRHDPSVKTIWLSTEMQSVVDDTRRYPAWEFLYTNTSRIFGADRIPDARQNVDHAFVNLMLSAEADYFVGALGSNWNRLIDELRKTLMGRLRAGHISFNIAE
ncbi:hypothetical protein KFL_003290140 [Klebsormidium nitens]|uniref:Uncharacterized protein n=1 Tax=Klebsormidium nitens TaxID=105231 RepID=A0A1Y1IED4_KLENI|nr:hypothetical protein KFL_003290140 [Klebsormidium nitens]|eukprot:GAQ87077.1 hypothetical protein KFL_003290140 [Klebsormidium nitens]